MPKPPIQFRHLKTSKLHDGSGNLMQRHWFEWHSRISLGPLTVRFIFEDADGKELTQTRFALPSVKLTGHTAEGTPTYDGAMQVYVDDIITHQPVQVRFYTISGLFKKSDSLIINMAGKREDLTPYGM